MKRIGKIALWILGIMAWVTLMESEILNRPFSQQIALIITGILLAIYIFRKTGSGAKDLEKENRELKAEVQQLRQELEQAQAVQRAMEKAEKRG